LNPLGWSAWGPFAFQASRALHYLVYFFLGMGIGAYGLERGFLARDGKLRRRWWLWCLASLVAFAVGTGVGIAAMTVHLGSRAWEIAGDSTFVLSCAFSSFAFLALIIRFAGKRSRMLDSLNENAYGIYLVHYAFVSWMQLALLKLELPAIVKAAMVFIAAGFLSWGTVALIRRVPLGQLARRGA
jgi:surface polysaccharide O-acyltransferase-like enzyme